HGARCVLPPEEGSPSRPPAARRWRGSSGSGSRAPSCRSVPPGRGRRSGSVPLARWPRRPLREREEGAGGSRLGLAPLSMGSPWVAVAVALLLALAEVAARRVCRAPPKVEAAVPVHLQPGQAIPARASTPGPLLGPSGPSYPIEDPVVDTARPP